MGASPGKLPRSIPGHQGDLEGPRGSCQPRGASQIVPGYQGDVEGPQGGHPALGSFLDPSQATRAVDPRGIPRAGTPGEGSSRRVPALGSFPKPFSGHQGDLEGPRGGCQPWGASQSPSQAFREIWRPLEVDARPIELSRPSETPGGLSRWVPALENLPGPFQAITETWWASRASRTTPRPSGRPGDPHGGCQP